VTTQLFEIGGNILLVVLLLGWVGLREYAKPSRKT